MAALSIAVFISLVGSLFVTALYARMEDKKEMKTRTKATIRDVMNLCGFSYFASFRCTDRNGNKGTRYVMEKEFSETQRSALSQFRNVVISTCRYRYAPEIIHDTIILTDRCI